MMTQQNSLPHNITNTVEDCVIFLSGEYDIEFANHISQTYENFYKRLLELQKRFDVFDWNYSKGSYDLKIEASRSKESKELTVNILSEKPGEPIYYTLDNSNPTITCILFETASN